MKEHIAETIFAALVELQDIHPSTTGLERANAPPDALLAEMRALGVLERAVRVALSEGAADLRMLDVTWREIGKAAGTSLQNAFNRWHPREPDSNTP